LGLGTEHGPFFVDKEGKLTPNPHSWNTVASILYVEQPAGVGFSYSETKEDYDTDDAKAASDNYVLIQEFLTRFPERQANDFHIASESYGGHYMPQCKSHGGVFRRSHMSNFMHPLIKLDLYTPVTKEILTRNTNGLINFRGFMVGNPYVDPFTNTLTQFRAFYFHGLVAKPLYDAWIKSCSDRNGYHPVVSVAVRRIIVEMSHILMP